MLMTVPLMIWSARTLIDSQACSTETSIAGAHRGEYADEQRRRDPEERARLGVGHRVADDDGRHEPDECGRQHHALDADVDDAAPLVHHAAQRAERDRRRQRQGLRGEVRVQDRVDQVADDLEDVPEERDVVEEVHQALLSP